MVDKKALGTVIDFLPPRFMKLIEENIGSGEDIKAAVKGKKGEALVVTDRGVHLFKDSETHRFFDYSTIKSARISRVYRRGRFELLVEEMERAAAAEEGDDIFEAESAENVINFPFAKMAMFKQAAKIINAAIGKHGGAF